MRAEQVKIILGQFGRLRHALMDASSIIYARKAGFCCLLGESLELFSPAPVIEETGFKDLPVKPVAANPTFLDNDALLVDYALRHRLPVVSEDKQVLSSARQHGIDHFNVLLLLHFLLYKRRIPPAKHSSCRQRLKTFARYSEEVYAVTAAVERAVLAIRANKSKMDTR